VLIFEKRPVKEASLQPKKIIFLPYKTTDLPITTFLQLERKIALVGVLQLI
jgi:hypothetical protein